MVLVFAMSFDNGVDEMTESNEPAANSRSVLQLQAQPVERQISSEQEIDLAMLAAAGGIAAASAEIARQVRARILCRAELVVSPPRPKGNLPANRFP
ncbi:hypothetical protein BH09CHL1_BH09CHL1_11870 [soil metagenome]